MEEHHQQSSSEPGLAGLTSHEEQQTCPNCGTLNRLAARYCQKCGDPLAPPAFSTNVTKPLSDSRQTSLVAPRLINAEIGSYLIQEVHPLPRSNYYKVKRTDTHLDPLPQGGTTSLLMHETVSQRASIGGGVDALIELSRNNTPGLLKHMDIFEREGYRYAVCESPEGDWQSLACVSLPIAERARVIEWCLSLGSALSTLGERGFVPGASSLADYLEPIVLVGQQTAYFADLSIFKPAETGPQTGTAQVNQKMIAFLGQVLYMLTSGKRQNLRRAPHDFSDVPPPFRNLVIRASGSEFHDLAAFLEAFKELKQANGKTTVARSLRQLAGYCTDVGQRRYHNEDFVGKYSLGLQQALDVPEVGLYLVADGMGGHQAGELASRDVVRVILSEIQENTYGLQCAGASLSWATIKLGQQISPGEVLKHAVQSANEVLFKARKQTGSDRGTTLTAALVVGEICAIANVGDSRTYLCREGHLEQITQDHSLVASLVAANMIQPEQMHVHPQRSNIYRSLGDRASVEIDIFECPLQVGDRLLLCSDGLWEMVYDPEILQIMERSANPQEACDRLVEAANLAGGVDNISVAAVWII